MRKLTVVGSVVATLSCSAAADSPSFGRVMRYDGPPPTVQLYTWTGLYVGGNAGAAWNDGAGSSDGGFIGGGQIGFNLRSGRIVYGLEAQLTSLGTGGSGDNGGSLVGFPDGATGSLDGDIDWVATLTARVGVAWDRTLFYVKAGPAWSHASYDLHIPAADVSFSGDENRTGWAVGLGYEYAFRSAWSVRLEYLYTDLGSDSVTLNGSAGSISVADVDQTVHAITLGVNYRFDWPAGSPLGTPY